jgi:dynein heavy chain 1
MQQDSSPLVNAYGAIEDLLKEVTTYVNVWLQYQSLWDMESGNIYGKLEMDLSMWQKLLMDVK